MSGNLRIAMWSGPRNLSTALMRSFSSRPNAVVLDEPFYASYLMQTGIAHPEREKVIAAYETDWEKIIDYITGPIPGGKAVWYQKQMAHHMLPQIQSQRLVESPALVHAFLIRDPAEVICSYTKVHSGMTIAETGLPYQADLFLRIRTLTGKVPPVIDANDVLMDPKKTLSRFCESLGIEFVPAMLHWPAGPHPADGNWAPHWYDSVYKSTGFKQYKPKKVARAPEMDAVLSEAQILYDQLFRFKL